LFGVAGISIDVYLGLGFVPKPRPGVIGVIRGEAAVTVGVHLLMFTKHVTLHVEKEFEIPPSVKLPVLGNVGVGDMPLVGQLLNNFALKDPSFDDTISESDWETYCRAFA
jgi:hypothetical protein